MREVIICRGVYGLRNESGRVNPVPRGECCAVPDEEAARLVSLGVAEYTESLSAAAVTCQDASEGLEVSNVAADNEHITDIPDGAEEETLSVDQLEKMNRADLEKLAADYGIDISGAKSNKERTALLAGALVSDKEETSPDLSVGDIVQ